MERHGFSGDRGATEGLAGGRRRRDAGLLVESLSTMGLNGVSAERLAD
jgi:hypothetical protein